MKKSEIPRKKIVLLDAHAIIHRAYHALPDFATADGQPTGALYGVCTMLFRIIETFRPYQIIACYDLPGGTFRHEAFSDYKGKRGEIEDSLKQQLSTSREVFHAFGIPVIDAPGFEADDVLGTLAHQIHRDFPGQYQIVIASGDMDTMQLITGDDTVVFTLKKGLNDVVLYDENAVIERYHFTPASIPDYKGLRGDTSDNIPGVPGIGEKTGTELILKYQTLENLYHTLDNHPEQLTADGFKARIVGLLQEHRESAEFSKILATIRLDAPVVFVPADHPWNITCDIDTVRAMLLKFEFKTLGNRLPGILSLDNSMDVSELENKTPAEPVDPLQGLDSETYHKLFAESQIMVWVLDSTLTNPDLETIQTYTGKKMIQDIHTYLEHEITAMGVGDVYHHIEKPLMRIIHDMQIHGVVIDKEALFVASKNYHAKLEILEKEIHTMTGHEFNINSPKQMGEVLFEKMDITSGQKGLRIKKNKSGTYSTAEAELEKLRDLHPVIEKILQYRELQKIVSTYIDPLPTFCDSENRIHAEFIQAGTTTGRFSSANPNLQNIPNTGEHGTMMRQMFCAPVGKKLLVVDYSQIELRIAAIMSGDKGLCSIFAEGRDIHTGVASRMFQVEPDRVTSDMRRNAKVINFGILYGMGITALSQNLGITRKEAEEYHTKYFAEFPTLRAFMDGAVISARKMGYSETMFGRRRYFPQINSTLPFIRTAAERAAANAPIQGTAADIMKLAMIHIDNRLRTEHLHEHVHMIMQIHDELVCEIDPVYTEQISEIVRDEMIHVFERSYKNIQTTVPLVISLGIGDNWASAK